MANLKPSKRTHDFFEDVLARRTGIRKNVWARIAAARSIALEEMPAEGRTDSEGAELAKHTVCGDFEALLKVAFTLRYKRQLSDDEFFPRLFKVHLERGAELLNADWELCGGRPEDFFIRLAEHLPAEAAPAIGAFPGIREGITLDIGTDTDSNAPQKWDLSRASNPHMCIVGTTGSGKTQFIKEMLAQVTEQTGGRLPFVFFDYARGDVAGDARFVHDTNAQVLELPDRPIPLQPLRRCRTDLEVNQQAHHLAKIFKHVAPRIGTVQEQRLINAVKRCYQHGRALPTFVDIKNEIEQGGQIDSLTSVLGKLTDLNLFPSNQEEVVPPGQLLGSSWVIALHKLQELRELVVFLALDAFRYHFNLLPDQLVEKSSGLKELRTVFVIDEAHNFLPKDKAQVLEKCLRELRGKGVAMWLLTQNPDDLDQAHYNYAAEVNFQLCLKVQDASPQVLSNLYGVPLQQARAYSAKLATFSGVGLTRSVANARGFAEVRVKQFYERPDRRT